MDKYRPAYIKANNYSGTYESGLNKFKKMQPWINNSIAFTNFLCLENRLSRHVYWPRVSFFSQTPVVRSHNYLADQLHTRTDSSALRTSVPWDSFYAPPYASATSVLSQVPLLSSNYNTSSNTNLSQRHKLLTVHIHCATTECAYTGCSITGYETGNTEDILHIFWQYILLLQLYNSL